MITPIDHRQVFIMGGGALSGARPSHSLTSSYHPFIVCFHMVGVRGVQRVCADGNDGNGRVTVLYGFFSCFGVLIDACACERCTAYACARLRCDASLIPNSIFPLH